MGNFKTKARAIELLGRKQIRDGVTALAELMKNSYDADAEWIRVEFVTEVNRPYILICDDGYGMDQEDIENKWLVLGTDSKQSNKSKKTFKGRTLMGAKGIGRLASARLGEQMWLFTRTKDADWNILYLNWNVFENPNLFIDQVTIPSIYELSLSKLDKDSKSIINSMKELQKENLMLPIWGRISEDGKRLLKTNTADLFRIIKSQINNVEVPIDHVISICSALEEDKFQGTIILIQNIRDNWEKFLLPQVSKKDKDFDVISYKNYNRFAAFASTFRYSADNLTVELLLNDKPLKFDFDYNEEDYKTYDLKIEGEVREGKFFGRLDARNAEENVLRECNIELENGLEITTGIGDWKKVDCGPYHVKLCHVEMDKKSSGLTDEEYARITAKMDTSGGISVFRDDVRVLPYGEPENDFLNLERRRSQNAGLYLFSHRNMFGRIDIDSENNPYLEDKSSREGIIENAQYYYFIQTLENLLIRIASEYVTSRGKKNTKALRDTYKKYNEEQAEKKKEEEESLKKEKALAKQEIQLYKSIIKDKCKTLLQIDAQMESFLGEWDSKAQSLTLSNGYVQLSQHLQKFKTLANEKRNYINKIYKDLLLKPSERFLPHYETDLLEEIKEYNRNLEEFVKTINENFSSGSSNIEKMIGQLIINWKQEARESLAEDPESYIKILDLRASNILKFIDNTLEDLNKKIYFEKDNVESKFKPIIEKSELVKKAELQLKASISKNGLDSFKTEIKSIRKAITSLTSYSPKEIGKVGIKIANMLDNIENKANSYAVSQTLSIANKFASLFPSIQPLLSYIESDTNLSSLVGILKKRNIELEKQLELYSDLANLGLSSEIVSHEFNQLFTNVFDAIKHLKMEKVSEDAAYWLRQIEIGFRAISDRQSQLSPMYRSYNLPKRLIKLYMLVEDIRNFYHSTLIRNKILFENHIDEDFEIKLSPSKIYPALSNLIHNSIYWVIDREEKIILFRYDEDERALFIEDSGPGVNSKFAQNIFEPFFSMKPGGRGLGLAITKRVLESQGHTIDIIFNREEKELTGACFKITFNGEE